MSYYNRRGEPISAAEWSSRLPKDQRVRETNIPGYWVSTVWLGLNHRLGDGPPLIFETMVFPTGPDGSVSSWGEVDAERYSTEEEAIAGHEAMVARHSTNRSSEAQS